MFGKEKSKGKDTFIINYSMAKTDLDQVQTALKRGRPLGETGQTKGTRSTNRFASPLFGPSYCDDAGIGEGLLPIDREFLPT